MPEMIPRLLERQFVEKVWGVPRLPQPFPHPSPNPIGEVWFEPPAEMPEILVKHIFTSERLSVQVHPNDRQAAAKGPGHHGKSECWLITSAEPGACIGVGFEENVTPDRLRAAALDGSIVDLISWHEVAVGDFFSIPANTVHAIGAGIGVIEIQQNSDTTYRLYDYGRPRELHLDDGLEVADGVPYPPSLRTNLGSEPNRSLIDGPHFRLSVRSQVSEDSSWRSDRAALVVPAKGGVSVDGLALAFGECAWVPKVENLILDDNSQVLLAHSLR